MNNQSTVTKARRKLITAIGIILCLIMLPILIANVTIIVKSYIDPDKIPSFLGYKPFIVLSDSMNPGIKAGDLVLSKEAAAGYLKVGDIISYRVGESVVTHRIVDITVTDGVRSYITKGDANNVDDTTPVEEKMIEGSYILDIPHLGNAALFMQTPAGMLICIGIPVLLLVFYDILRRRRYDREKQLKTIELEKELELMRGQINIT